MQCTSLSSAPILHSDSLSSSPNQSSESIDSNSEMNLNKQCTFMVGCFLVFVAVSELGLCREGGLIRLRPGLGGIREFNDNHNSLELESLARFAVEEHNKHANSLLKFARVLKSKEQVVAGKVYYLTLEAIDAGKKKIYEAKVWVKPWMNFKKLEEFKYSTDAPSFTSSDLGAKKGGGWRVVPTQDPEVQDAAKRAVKTLQARSNSLYPYVLVKILLAKAEVIETSVRFQLVLKLRRGTKEEEFKVVVNKSAGVFLKKKIDQRLF